jgi:hypothetical protein
MQFTIEEQRSIERGEPLRITPPELAVECVVVRADVYDRMQAALSTSPHSTALPAKSALGSMPRKQPVDSRFKPADRRWNLVGMLVGTTLGALPVIIPAPIGPALTFGSLGALVGFVVPLWKLHHWHEKMAPRTLWMICGGGAVVGALFGVFAWLMGLPLKPEQGLTATGTCGLLAGFAVVDTYLKRYDARRRQEESLWDVESVATRGDPP